MVRLASDRLRREIQGIAGVEAAGDLGLRPNRRAFGRGMMLGGGLVVSSFAIAMLAGGFDLTTQPSGVAAALALLSATAMGVAFEEIAFRSGWMGSLHQAFPKWVVVGTPAAAFALLHLGNEHASPLAMTNSVLLSLFTGWCFLGTEESEPRIAAPLGFHFGWNQPILGTPVSGHDRSLWLVAEPTDPLLSGGQYGLEGSLVTTVLAILTVALGGRLVPWMRASR